MKCFRFGCPLTCKIWEVFTPEFLPLNCINTIWPNRLTIIYKYFHKITYSSCYANTCSSSDMHSNWHIVKHTANTQFHNVSFHRNRVVCGELLKQCETCLVSLKMKCHARNFCISRKCLVLSELLEQVRAGEHWRLALYMEIWDSQKHIAPCVGRNELCGLLAVSVT
jgi:hypothetical protein